MKRHMARMQGFYALCVCIESGCTILLTYWYIHWPESDWAWGSRVLIRVSYTAMINWVIDYMIKLSVQLLFPCWRLDLLKAPTLPLITQLVFLVTTPILSYFSHINLSVIQWHPYYSGNVSDLKSVSQEAGTKNSQILYDTRACNQ